MLDIRRFTHNVRPSVFSTIYFAALLILIILANTLFSAKFSDEPSTIVPGPSRKLALLSVTEEVVRAGLSFDPPRNASEAERIAWFRTKLPHFEILKSTEKSKEFDSKAKNFFNRGGCKLQVFMTWISPAASFGIRELLALESLFNTNPQACLVIASTTLDSAQGYMILNPLTDLGFKVRAMSPDLNSLFKNTPAEAWFEGMKTGEKDPGEIPLPQNLSNLIRLALLYKYGGIYLDTDFIILKDLSKLRNSIGAQSTDKLGNWTRLNNAVLVFDKAHPILHEFIDEFARTFDGNKWGHNGPYLVSRVISKQPNTKDYDLTIMTPMAFYPVDWTRIRRFFERPLDRVSSRWVEAKLKQLGGGTYGIHLWNKQSRMMLIEEGGVLGRLVSDHCIICKGLYAPHSLISSSSKSSAS
ncbi:hypothetical protein QQ045_029914 [Rhodiola kirilowii]